MQDLTEAARHRVEEIASRHAVSPDATATLLRALAPSGGSMAQFSHPELGGMGQWSQGGMIMIGDMFNNGLKARVDALCRDLAALLREVSVFAPPPSRHEHSPPGGGWQSLGTQSQFQGNGGFGFASTSWWPPELGSPASSGGQNDMRYAHFPEANRLAVQQDGTTRLYDTGGVQIWGVSQQQGGGQSLSFSTSQGELRVERFHQVDGPGLPAEPASAPPPPAQPFTAPGQGQGAEHPLITLEKLGELHQRGILSDAEFAAKKAELLARL